MVMKQTVQILFGLQIFIFSVSFFLSALLKIVTRHIIPAYNILLTNTIFVNISLCLCKSIAKKRSLQILFVPIYVQ